MERIFLSIVLLSAATGILALLLKGFFRFSKKQYRARSKCMVWTALLLSMMLPFSINMKKPFAGVLPTGTVSTQNQFTLLPGETAAYAGLQIPENNWITVFTWLWLGGMALMLLVKFICYAAFSSKLKQQSEMERDARTNQTVKEICGKLGIRRQVRLYRTTETETPLLMGIFRPSIYLPENSWTAKQEKLVLLHELSHCKSHDLLLRFLLMIVTAVHWFNPAVYLIGRELKDDLEEACDAAVLEQSSMETRKLYGKTVLETACRQSTGLPLVSATFATHHSRLKNRCQRILSGDGALCWGKGLMIGACSLAAALVVACALIPKPQVSADDQKVPPASFQHELEAAAAPVEAESWLFPLEGDLYVTAPYGEELYSFHKGLDVTREGISGEEVHAAKAGVVVTANTAAHAYGNYVVIDHGDGYETLYAHCQSLAVEEGQQVAQGETIAFVGSTGNSTGPHLHFEVQKNGELFDPAQIFPDLKELG